MSYDTRFTLMITTPYSGENEFDSFSVKAKKHSYDLTPKMWLLLAVAKLEKKLSQNLKDLLYLVWILAVILYKGIHIISHFEGKYE